MRENYLYKCTDCHTVRAELDDYGESTWALTCKACGAVTTEHYKIDVMKMLGKLIVVCDKEKEDDDIKDDKK